MSGAVGPGPAVAGDFFGSVGGDEVLEAVGDGVGSGGADGVVVRVELEPRVGFGEAAFVSEPFFGDVGIWFLDILHDEGVALDAIEVDVDVAAVEIWEAEFFEEPEEEAFALAGGIAGGFAVEGEALGVEEYFVVWETDVVSGGSADR